MLNKCIVFQPIFQAWRGGRFSPVNIETRIRPGRPRNCGLVSGEGKRFFSFLKHSNHLWHPDIHPTSYVGFFSGEKTGTTWSYHPLALSCNSSNPYTVKTWSGTLFLDFCKPRTWINRVWEQQEPMKNKSLLDMSNRFYFFSRSVRLIWM